MLHSVFKRFLRHGCTVTAVVTVSVQQSNDSSLYTATLQQINDPTPRQTHRYHVCATTDRYTRDPSVRLLGKDPLAKAAVSLGQRFPLDFKT